MTNHPGAKTIERGPDTLSSMSDADPITRPVIPVVLSGGSGTRLWPLSRAEKPKQFLPLVSSRSLFQETLLRVAHLGPAMQPPIVVCNEAHQQWVAEQSLAVGIELGAIVLEPVARNTAPAVALAALLVSRRMEQSGSASDPLLLVLPADHVITNEAVFSAAVRIAADAAAANRLVTFGVVPDRPETGYGYIRRGEQRGAWAAIDRFVEKPDAATAERYVASGAYLWNSGMFLFSTRDVLGALRAHAGPILDACERAVAQATVEGMVVRPGREFLECPADSVDYAVMEKTDRGAVVSLAAGWSDVGSWSALHDVSPRDSAGNTVQGNVLLESCTNTYVTAQGRLVAAVGLDDVVIVETDDSVLVMHRSRAQDVKQIVERIKASRTRV